MAWRLMPVRWPFAVRARLKGPVRAACEALERRAYFAAAFGAATPLPVNKQLAGNTIRSVASGDFNADGNEDLAVVNTQDNGIDILLNGGNGQFTLKSVLPDGGGQVTGLAAADLGNGQIDIVASNVTTGSLYVFIGSGNGTFAAPAIYKFGTPQSGTVAATDLVTVASLFGTTSSDLIVADDVDARIVTFRNLGTGIFTAAQSLATPTPGSVIVGDFFNATGLQYAVTNTGQAFVIGTTGTITRLGALNFSLPTNQAYTGTGTVATADFNNDGIADIARIFVGADGKSYLDIVPGGNGSLGNGTLSPITTGATTLAVGDFNADGNEDVLVGTPTTSELFNGNGKGGFTDSRTSLAVGNWTVAAVDAFTTSGNLDVVLPGISTATGKPGAFLFTNGASSGNSTTVTLSSSQNPAGPGQLVLFTATVQASGVAGTGRVKFFDSGHQIGTAGLINGVAHFRTRKLPVGNNTIVAKFTGNATVPSASSAGLHETVGPGLGFGNLTLSFSGRSLPATLVAGSKISQSLRVANKGTGSSTGISHVSFYASPAPTFDAATAVTVAAVKQRFSLKVGHALSFLTSLPFPSSLSAGNYYLLAVIADGNGHTNTVASSSTIAVASPFVDLSDQLRKVAASGKPGKRSSVSLEVFNTGNVIASGQLSILLETSSAVDGSDPQDWTTLAKRISIKPKGHAVLSLSGILPASLGAGSYFVVATVDPADTFSEPSLADNIAVSTKAIAVT